jgi:CDP-paratose 2-epimerase
MRLLITGGCGFLGSNLAAEALRRCEALTVFDDLSRIGSADNLAWLEGHGGFAFVHGDIRNANDVEGAVAAAAPDVVFHLAGQVAMTQSLREPRRDFEINALGTLNVLESVRRRVPECAVLYSSTNKVYGDLEWIGCRASGKRYVAEDYPHGFDETLPLKFHSPYGCSKGCADQYVLDYARMYGLRTAVFRHSSMYGGRQFATVDQGWVGWFCAQALHVRGDRGHRFTVAGTGLQVRDLLHAEDMVRLYFAAADRMDALQGEAFNIGGGMDNSLSLLELFDLLEDLLQIRIHHDRLPPRESDQRIFVADLRKIRARLGWVPEVSARDGVARMLEWLLSGQGRRCT